MNMLKLLGRYLAAKPLNTFLNILLLGLGIAVITVLILFRNQLEHRITENSRGIDLVIGAKGSPLQLILCNIFHIDFPTGNIKLAEAERISKHRLIKKAIPLALGDSYKEFRIIGTTRSYTELYDLTLASGAWWSTDMEVNVGARVASTLNLTVGDHFSSTHGLSAEGHSHEENHFVVKGIFDWSNTVADNLILTNVESVWKVHDVHVNGGRTLMDTTSVEKSRLVPSVAANDSLKEITSLLVQYRSPMGALQLPRYVNSQSSMQAASPAFETARLFSILGAGIEMISAFAAILIFISALSIFIALYNALKERRYDLAIMRTMGATKRKLFVVVILEGISITFAGAFVGMLLGHLFLSIASKALVDLQNVGLSGFVFYEEEAIIMTGSLLLGIVCSVIPALQIYRTDISETLAGN
ncbi:MAG TPA: FtsX-like permease family protein [Chryseosolibacter sp.]|nr:FtsX-like permease family protein [Chryseosolibacter sp.]